MKRTLRTLAWRGALVSGLLMLMVPTVAWAQNTFPPTGNVVIGTASVGGTLDIQASSGGLLTLLGTQISADSAGSTDYLFSNRWGTSFKLIGFGNTHASRPSTFQIGAFNAEQSIAIVADNQSNVEAGTSTRGIFLHSGGNVGIGTASPTTAKMVISATSGGVGLDLSSANANLEARVIANSLSGLDKDLYLQFGAGAGSKLHLFSNNAETMTVTSGNVGIGTTSPAAKLHVAGDAQVDGNLAAKYQDVAEWVEAPSPLSPGVVVIVAPRTINKVLEAFEPYDTRVAGVVSAQPGLLLGQAGDRKVKVAHSGRVKVKVDTSYGSIAVGDLLVTSPTPGHAMRSQPLELGGAAIHRPGTLLGKALESLESGRGEILVLLTLQ